MALVRILVVGSSDGMCLNSTFSTTLSHLQNIDLIQYVLFEHAELDLKKSTRYLDCHTILYATLNLSLVTLLKEIATKLSQPSNLLSFFTQLLY